MSQKGPDLRRDYDRKVAQSIVAEPSVRKDLIYEGITTILRAYILRPSEVRMDLIYEGITTRA